MKTKNRLLILVALVVGAALSTESAFAITALKQVQVSNGSQVDLLFDGKVTKNQIKTEFFNDIIQISLTDVSVYPAKISSVNGGNLTKIFAYQYAPKLVRCRLSVKGLAESYKDKLVVSPGGANGRMLTVRLEGTNAVIQATKAQSKEDLEEAALLERVSKGSPSQPSAAVAAAIQEKAQEKMEKISDRIVEKAAAPAPAQGSSYSESESKPIALGKNEGRGLGGAKNNIPSPLGVFGKLALVVGLFSLLALGLKKFLKNKGENNNAIFGAIGKFARTSLGVKGLGSAMAIEIIANHHLGPKKSIAVVKVGGRTLVVGITEQAINLIAQLSSEEDAMNALVELDNPPLENNGPSLSTAPSAGATAAGPAIFSKMLQSETSKPVVTSPVVKQSRPDVRVTNYGGSAGVVAGPVAGPVTAQAAIGLSGVRAQIKTKLEGLKQI